jgi:hypothetical protein
MSRHMDGWMDGWMDPYPNCLSNKSRKDVPSRNQSLIKIEIDPGRRMGGAGMLWWLITIW